ncbi:MAG TPA: cytochrome c3 family protein [Geobacteraceae bacterium]
MTRKTLQKTGLSPLRRAGAYLAGGIVAVLACLHPGAASDAHAAITFVYPAQKELVKRSDYLVLWLNNPEITGVKITINGLESDLLKTGTPEYRKAFRDFLILQAMWDQGKNSITVDGYSGDKKIESVTTDIYFLSGAADTAVPEEFRKLFFHSAENERLCSPCHNMNPSAVQSEESLGKANPCYTCHSKMLNLAFVHGPAGTFSCVYCHSGKEGPKYAAPRREVQLCGECHVDQVADFRKHKLQHGPVAAGMCEICHDPHGSANNAQLREPINTLCLSCHEDVGKGTHVVAVPSGGGHPLSGKPDPSRPGTGRMMSCVSCHDPHAGDHRYYFQNNLETNMELCQLCHNK